MKPIEQMATETTSREVNSHPHTPSEIVRWFASEVREGVNWGDALLQAISMWTVPKEKHAGRYFEYMIGGEAFDWLLLAERICLEADALIPIDEHNELLLLGKLPPHIDQSRFQSLLGASKHRAYLNYWYGVVVEQALQMAIEVEVRKANQGKVMFEEDITEQVYQHIYGASQDELLQEFYRSRKQRPRRSMNLIVLREFTYWLFKRRWRVCDPARVASDTRKGLSQLQKMRQTIQLHNPSF
jgi:hypothetical protein